MTRTICLTLTLSLLLSLAGCGKAPAAPQETAASVTESVTAVPTEATTEPTLSAEELFLQSLPEKLRLAHDLGIAQLSLLEDPDRTCTAAEAAGLLQNAYTSKLGKASKMLTMAAALETSSQSVNRGDFATMMYAAAAETFITPDLEDYAANLKKLTDTSRTEAQIAAGQLLGYTGFLVMPNQTPKGLVDRYSSADATVAAHSIYRHYGGAFHFTADRKDFSGDDAVLSYALTRFDRTTGEKLMSWDENYNFRFLDTMTVKEAVETALRYYNALEPEIMVPYEDITSYDKTIITDDLLTRESSLPDASCQNLPASWKGVWVRNQEQNMDRGDRLVYEHEIQAIKDAGFNMVNVLFTFQYYHGEWGQTPIDGHMSEHRLKELDRILAWCMERDIHLNLMCYHSNGWPSAFQEVALAHDVKNAEPLANSWGVLAQRYRDIPNKYLSFTLFFKPLTYNDEDHGAFSEPIINAIRAASPDRCIIAHVGQTADGTTVARQGVALSCAATWPNEFYFDYFTKGSAEKTMQTLTWPMIKNGQTVDSSAVFANHSKDYAYSPDEIAAVAEANGVGFMVSNFGPRMSYGSQTVFDARPNDETMEAFLRDMTDTMANRGWGWSYTNWYGFAGIACQFPLVKDASYTKVENRPLYIDNAMTSIFQTINRTE